MHVVNKNHLWAFFLQELTLVTKPGEGFGFSISGGVNGHPGNPFDETDEGIFINQVVQNSREIVQSWMWLISISFQIIPGGAAERDGRLKVGTRILQVYLASLLYLLLTLASDR